jgi:hypothetical protein
MEFHDELWGPFSIHLQAYHWAGTMEHKDIQKWLIDHGAQVRDY